MKDFEILLVEDEKQMAMFLEMELNHEGYKADVAYQRNLIIILKLKSLLIKQKIEEEDKDLVYKNLRIESKEYGVGYIQIVKDMDNEYDFMKILFVFMAIADFIGIIASIILGHSISKNYC